MLHLDQALLTVYNKLDLETLHLFTKLDACIDCPPQERLSVEPHKHGQLKLNTAYGTLLIVKAEFDKLCNFTGPFEDQGKYELYVVNETCELKTVKSGRNNLWPLLVALVLITVSFCLYQAVSYINRRRNETPVVNPNQQRRPRVNCVDSFRGIVILLMIFANNNSGGYVFLNHAAWFGYNLADCVFPFFMFIMGISIAFSLQSQMRRVEPQLLSICFNIIRRSIILFFLGIMINSIGETRLEYIRIPGVLQRFAICYLVVALLHLVSLHESRRRVEVDEPNNTSFKRHFIDIYPYWVEWLFVVAMTAIYFSLTLDWKYDDNCPLGYQGPGGLHDNAAYPNCTGGAARALDVKILGVNHIYKHSSARKVFENELSHDPEGILGTTTSILIVFLGLQVGKVFSLFRSHRQRLLRWTSWCFLTGVITLCLWLNGAIPVCKNLWSLTYVMFSAFLAFIVLIVFYIIIDVKRWWVRGAPFNIPGMNSIFLYIGHEVCSEIFPFYYEVDNTSHAWLLFRSVMTTGLWFLVSVIMAKKRIFISL